MEKSIWRTLFNLPHEGSNETSTPEALTQADTGRGDVSHMRGEKRRVKTIFCRVFLKEPKEKKNGVVFKYFSVLGTHVSIWEGKN